MFSHKTAVSLALLAMLVMVAESSWGSGGQRNYNHDISSMSGLRGLFNSRVHHAERVTRPLDGLSFQKGDLSHSGVRVTLEDGSKYLVHKGDRYGLSTDTVVTDARHMSSNWKPTGEAKDFGGSRSVSDFVKAGGSNYNILKDNCHDASRRMMNQ